jgi:hypothetical protein
MTIPAFGRCTPVQIAMLELAGYDLGVPKRTFVHDVEERLAGMREGRGSLVLLTGQDYGFDLRNWRGYLLTSGEDLGYTHPYAFRSVDRAVEHALADAGFSRLVELAGASGDDPPGP